jgi:CRISPR type III-B/RAMP module RAMP protein Cmr6
MPIHAPSDTLQALGQGLLPHCSSRSLFATRFTDPASSDRSNPTRKQWFQSLTGRKAEGPVPAANWLPESATVIHARLMARMMVNLAGGTMENANVLLNRQGYPYIPGSAVKGCARRMALQALHDWPQSGESDAGDPTAPCRQGFQSKADMLATIARVFGWVGQDWENGKNKDRKTGQETTWKSDFAWACHGDANVIEEASRLAGGHDSFGGSIAFLDAQPNTDPGLELDVVTPHGSDTENPIPVFFPAIGAQLKGDFFAFPLLPIARAKSEDFPKAVQWLSNGLEIFGLGAKTNAGYGWFHLSSDSQPGKTPREKFMPPKSPAQNLRSQWAGRTINAMSAGSFIREAAKIESAAELAEVLEQLAPGKVSRFDTKDPFWNPFKVSPQGKAILETIKTTTQGGQQ